MNIDKILGSLSDLWARHSPTVIMHVAMFVLLQWWVTTRVREIPEILPWWKIQAWQKVLTERVS